MTVNFAVIGWDKWMIFHFKADLLVNILVFLKAVNII